MPSRNDNILALIDRYAELCVAASQWMQHDDAESLKWEKVVSKQVQDVRKEIVTELDKL